MFNYIKNNQAKIDEYVKDHTLSRMVNGIPYYTKAELDTYFWGSGGANAKMFTINDGKLELIYLKLYKDLTISKRPIKIKIQDVRFVGNFPGCAMPMLITKYCAFYMTTTAGKTYLYRDHNYTSTPPQNHEEWEKDIINGAV